MKVKVKILTRSTNSNSFGLRNHVLILENGLAFRALRSGSFHDSEKYAPNTEHTFGLGVGDALEVKTLLCFANFECVEELSPPPPAALIKELFSL